MSKIQDMILQEIASKALVDKMKGNVNEAKIKLGDIVIAKAGPHKGVKHTVIHDYGDGKYNIQPIGLRPNKIQYKLGAASAKENELKFVKAGKGKPKTTTIDTSGMSKAQIVKALRAKRGLKDEGKLNEGKNLKNMSDTDLIATLDHLKTGPANLKDLSTNLIKMIEKEIKRRGIKEGKINEAPMDDRFAKTYKKSGQAIRNHIKHELSKKKVYTANQQRELQKSDQIIKLAMEVPNNMAKIIDEPGKIREGKLTESTKAYGDALKAMERERTAASLSKKDKDTLLKLADLMKKHGMVKEANVNPKFKKAIHKFVNNIAKKYDIPPTSVVHTIKSVLGEVEEDKLFPKKDKEDKDLKELNYSDPQFPKARHSTMEKAMTAYAKGIMKASPDTSSSSLEASISNMAKRVSKKIGK